MAQELKVIADFYDFMLWLIRHTEKFPRHHRYSLGLAHRAGQADHRPLARRGQSGLPPPPARRRGRGAPHDP